MCWVANECKAVEEVRKDLEARLAKACANATDVSLPAMQQRLQR